MNAENDDNVVKLKPIHKIELETISWSIAQTHSGRYLVISPQHSFNFLIFNLETNMIEKENEISIKTCDLAISNNDSTLLLGEYIYSLKEMKELKNLIKMFYL